MEWRKLKNLVIAYKNVDQNELWRIITSLEEFKILNLITATFLTLPISTVECERVFSRMNKIKTESRARLSTKNLDHLLNICLNTSDNADEIDFDVVINAWKNKKNRLFCL